MRRDPRSYLWDAQTAADNILTFTHRRSLDEYLGDVMLRSAVERQFEIIGEALGQLTKAAPNTAQRVPDVKQIIAFRDLLVDGYAAVDHRTVWCTIQQDLPNFRNTVARLLAELGEAP